jgi:diguanylate cyclase (GGDEF)-like protein/PAS domain S-box-containing protein
MTQPIHPADVPPVLPLAIDVPPRATHARRLAHRFGLALEAHFLLPLFGLLLLGSIWFGVLQMIEAERRSAAVTARDATRELLDIYEAQMARSLSSIDQALLVLKYAVQRDGGAGAIRTLAAKGLLPSGLVFQVEIADSKGRVVASNPASDVHDLSYTVWFNYHRVTPADLPYVSQTGDVPGGSGPNLHFSRRIEDAAGRFAGVAIITIDPAYFTSAYEPSRQGEQGLLGMVGEDGVVRALRIGNQQSWGQRYRGGDGDGTVTLTTNGIDDVMRYSGSRALSGFPLVAVAGLAESEQMTLFHQQTRTWLWIAGAGSALLIAAVALLSTWAWQMTKARRREQSAQETYAAASEASPDAFFVLRHVHAEQGRITDFTISTTNRRAEQLTRLCKEELAGQSMSLRLTSTLGASIFEDLAAVARGGAPHEAEWQASRGLLAERWLHRQAVAVENGVVLIVRDITERKLAEQRIRHVALHDELTGLPNRSLLRERLEQAIDAAAQGARSVALAFLDLDGFKLVNDTLGHQAGDELLKIVGVRMAHCLNDGETLARFGGDEFVILLPNPGAGPAAALPLLEQVRQAVTAPILVAGQEVQISASIGVAFYPQDGIDASALMMHADVAMYCAKDLGSNNVKSYDRQMNAAIEQKLKLMEGLRAAIDSCRTDAAGPCQFEVLYQPKVDLRSGRIFGAEALIRWHHPEQGIISPTRFIGLAEESGLIVPIGEWVLRTACTQNQAWRVAGMTPVTVSVNVSARQFEERRLAERIRAALDDSGLPPHALEVEVTETLIMRDMGRSVDTMRQLEAMGVALSVDDFGTGYSSLSTLKAFPISSLKLDKSFVSDLADSADDQAIALAVISLAHKLGLRVIAEGVETEQQRDFLRAHDCDEMQGFLFSHPVSAQQFAELLAVDQAYPFP